MKTFVIIGSGGFAKEIYAIAKAANKNEPTWDFIGFIDTDDRGDTVIDGFEVIGDDDYVSSNLNSASVAIGIGDPGMREKVYEKYKKNGTHQFPNVIHPSVIGDFENITMDEANIVAGNSIFSTDIRMGRGNVINMASIIAHDVRIANFCTINPGANVLGKVTIEDHCVIGSNSVIHPGVTLNEGTVLGLGSSLTRDSKPYSTYLGNPAKKIS